VLLTKFRTSTFDNQLNLLRGCIYRQLTSVPQQFSSNWPRPAQLSHTRNKSILAMVTRIKLGQAITVKHFQRLLGLIAAASNMIPFGLLQVRALQWWLKTKGFSQRRNPFRMIRVTIRCLHSLSMWKNPVPRSSAGSAMLPESHFDRRIPHGLGCGHGLPLYERSVAGPSLLLL